MKIALASDDGVSVDAVFEDVTSFVFFEVGTDASRELGRVDLGAVLAGHPGTDDEDEGRVHAKIAALAGATLMFVLSIGDAANTLVLRARSYPVMLDEPETFEQVVARVRTMLEKPPPWLRKLVEAG